ncbi:MAG: LLM class flavin-dependent oxidoreductase [Candidatus Kariarchaeaceae archaeon]
MTTISFLAGKTETINFGISTLVLPQRNPIIVAKQLATLDFLTKGRITTSFGAGQEKQEFNYLQQDFHDRGKRFNEQLRLIQTLWQGKTSFDGEYYRLEDAIFLPLPHRNIPIYIGGRSKFALHRAVKYAGWHPTSIPASEVAELREQYGHPDLPIIYRLTVQPSTDLSKVLQEFEEVGVDHFTLRFSEGIEGLKQSKNVLSAYL